MSLQKESEWEKEFDKYFQFLFTLPTETQFRRIEAILSNGNTYVAREETETVKAFIKAVLSTREKEIAEEVEKMKKEMPDRIDEEDVPGVTDQVIGYNKALDDFLQLLKQ